MPDSYIYDVNPKSLDEINNAKFSYNKMTNNFDRICVGQDRAFPACIKSAFKEV